ncbi:hypothetical protein LB505_001286 [Fusarium chuoi]|nr:hypothetical protein LB505_001286 [Fusarium chuoi]
MLHQASENFYQSDKLSTGPDKPQIRVYRRCEKFPYVINPAAILKPLGLTALASGGNGVSDALKVQVAGDALATTPQSAQWAASPIPSFSSTSSGDLSSTTTATDIRIRANNAARTFQREGSIA